MLFFEFAPYLQTKLNSFVIRKKLIGSCEIRLAKRVIVVDYGETAEFPHVFDLNTGQLLYEVRDICEREKEIIEDFSNFGSCYFPGGVLFSLFNQ